MSRELSLDDMARLAYSAGFDLPEASLPVLHGYLTELLRWNRVMNLVGARSASAAFSTLFVDSFHLDRLVRRLPLPAEPKCWDLGAGAGLPGIPLRALWQAGGYTLVEAREKRALFLKTILARFPLPGMQVFHGRAEDFMAGDSGPADLIVSRAFMPWEKLLPFVRPHLAEQGVLLLLLREKLTLPEDSGWNVLESLTYKVGGDARVIMALTLRG